MKKLNNKGFSLVELLAVVTILGILMGVGVQAYGRYLEKARKQSYDSMGESSINATKSYLTDNAFFDQSEVCTSSNVGIQQSISTNTLVSEGYLEELEDPSKSTTACSGTVTYKMNNCASVYNPDMYSELVAPDYDYHAKIICHGQTVYNK